MNFLKSLFEKMERLKDECCVISNNKLSWLTPTTIFEYVMNFPPFCDHCTVGFEREVQCGVELIFYLYQTSEGFHHTRLSISITSIAIATKNVLVR